MPENLLWAAMYKYIAENPDKAKHTTDIAKLTGVDRREIYAVFSGGKIVSDNMLKKLSDFFGLNFEDVRAEHYLAIERRGKIKIHKENKDGK